MSYTKSQSEITPEAETAFLRLASLFSRPNSNTEVGLSDATCDNRGRCGHGTDPSSPLHQPCARLVVPRSLRPTTPCRVWS